MKIITELSTEELQNAIEEAVKRALPPSAASVSNTKPIKGIHELARFLGISPSRAQKLKNDGVLKYWQDGRLVFFDRADVIEKLYSIRRYKK